VAAGDRGNLSHVGVKDVRRADESAFIGFGRSKSEEMKEAICLQFSTFPSTVPQNQVVVFSSLHVLHAFM
jgi:hypothetical protein